MTHARSTSPLRWGALALMLTTLAGSSLATTVSRSTPQAAGTEAAALHLFDAQLAELGSRPDDNVVFSPSSLAAALVMAGDAADGRTRHAFEKTLGLERGTLEAFERTLRDGLFQTQADAAKSGHQFSSASMLWVANGTHLFPSFRKHAETVFGVAPKSVNFSDPASTAAINDWVKTQTHGNIPSIVDHLDPATQFALVNGTYFRGTWAIPFDAKQTQPKAFHRASGGEQMIPMMEHSALAAQYAETAQLKAVRLPFKDGKFNLTVVLPKANGSGTSAQDLAQITQHWRELHFQSAQGHLVLPKFHVAGSATLNELLRQAGLEPAFTPCADFTRMSDDPLQLSDVLQKTTLDVSEEGAEASAATAVLATRSALSTPPAQFDMIVDRPFLVILEHSDLTLPIMIARVGSPVPGTAPIP